MDVVWIVVLAVIILAVVITVVRAVVVIPQATAAVIERLGRYRTTARPGLNFLVPFIDRIRARVDLREQVVSFPPQAVITQDNLTVSIDTVVYFQVTNPHDAVYEISNYIIGVEQLTTTTLRNLVGGMSLEETLTSRDQINGQLRGVLDEATGRWGIRVARVELKAIDPPPSIQDSMEKQMRADREKRAMILTAEGERESAIKTAEGQKQSQILAAEGAKQAAILSAEADRQSRILRGQGERAGRYLQAQGQAKAIEKVFTAIKAGRPTPELLAYQYLQTLPQMAQGDANKVWMVPSDFGKALEGFTRMLGAPGEDGVFRFEPSEPEDQIPESRPEEEEESVASWFDTSTNPEVAAAVRAAEEVARKEVPGPAGIGPGPSAESGPTSPPGLPPSSGGALGTPGATSSLAAVPRGPAPGAGQPGSGQPGSGQPGSGQPESGQPSQGQPGSGQSAPPEREEEPSEGQPPAQPPISPYRQPPPPPPSQPGYSQQQPPPAQQPPPQQQQQQQQPPQQPPQQPQQQPPPPQQQPPQQPPPPHQQPPHQQPPQQG